MTVLSDTEAEVIKDRERVERCLAAVQAYEASGQKASVWAQANGVAMRDLASWCAHARRWRARLQESTAPGAAGGSAEAGGRGFVAVALPAAPVAEVRVQWPTAAGPVWLHWPLGHARELGAWLREVGR